MTNNQIPDKQEMVLARLGEIALKGLNRRVFERRLFNNLQRRLGRHGLFNVTQSDSRIWIIPLDERAAASLDEALAIACSVFGLVSASRVTRYRDFHDMEAICRAADDYLTPVLADGKARRFKVEARRGDKRLPFRSPEICAEVGAFLLEKFPTLSVDVHQADFILQVELRDGLYIFHESCPGLRGLPVGSSGKGLLLLSGGIDSPVAAFMMASRGMEIEAVYFHAFPYTSDQAKEKVLKLSHILCDYIGRLTVHVVDFTDTQLTLREKCPQNMMTIVMRRMMMRDADALADKLGCEALITGESLGQVASQTTEALATTNAVVTKPVFRPLIGVDKDETVKMARRIGTFETSILPYEDCCTVFVPRHPRTRPTLAQARAAERDLDIEALVSRDLEHIEAFHLP